MAILAGGLATRLRPITETIPKSLVEVAGEPFLAHQLRLLSAAGVTRAVVCTGHLGDQIRGFAGDGREFGLRVDYSWDGPMLLGTAGAVRRALPLLGEAFLVIYGDSYLPCDYSAVERTFIDSRKQGLMTIFHNNGHYDASNVEFVDGRITSYDKHNRTPQMRYIDYGLGAFRNEAFKALPGETRDLADVYKHLLSTGQLEPFEVGERFYEVGSFEGIRALSEHLTGRRQ